GVAGEVVKRHRTLPEQPPTSRANSSADAPADTHSTNPPTRRRAQGNIRIFPARLLRSTVRRRSAVRRSSPHVSKDIKYSFRPPRRGSKGMTVWSGSCHTFPLVLFGSCQTEVAGNRRAAK